MQAPDRQRALALLRRQGWATVSFQSLETGFRYWFDDDAFVAYVDVGGAWVAAGPPVAPEARLRIVAERFVGAARASGRRACLFGCEARFVEQSGFPAMLVGEQPVWTPEGWASMLASRDAASLRYQLRRARRKGVIVRTVDATEVADPTSALRAEVTRVADAWLANRRMAPMSFLVQLEPLTYPAERVVHVAERDGQIVGVLSAIPVYARRRLFIEDLVRAPSAPNGTTEALIHAAMQSAAMRGDAAVTFGLAPLAGTVAPALRLARAISGPLYDFRGLQAFKAKLRPGAWEPVFLCAAPGRSTVVALRDALAAFAGGSLVRFGIRTLWRRRDLLAVGVALVIAIAALAVIL